MASFSVRAPAKINLDLRVLHQRTDGYHELRTVLQELALHDTLSFTPARGALTLTVSSGEAPAGEANIVWKAARAVWAAKGRAGEPSGAAIRLVKRIPTEAGLGGGSSDAAAALVALNRIWKGKLSDRDLMTIAATLGADVPFFLVGGTALGLGRGDEVFPLPDLPPWYVVLARPPGGVSTSEAYAALRQAGTGREETRDLDLPWAPGSMAVRNDFEALVCRQLPDVARLRDGLQGCGARLAQLTGSGSAVFGLFAREAEARRAARAVGGPGVWTWVTRFRRRRRGRRGLAGGKG